MLNLVDSSGWVEFFVDGDNAGQFAPLIEEPAGLLVPTIVIYEVTKRLLQQWSEADALEGYAFMARGNVVSLDAQVALEAAQVSLTYKLPMADSVILATARAHGATVWTQDKHFEGLADVRYIPRQ